jgi:hypothetical protein
MRDWTFMVYMAGDNGKIFDGNKRLMHDLQAYGWRDLVEMSEVGSTERVAIVAQYDTLDNQQFTPRFFIDGIKPSGRLVDSIRAVNTGDPKNLTDFIAWGAKNYPAHRYALVLWNHGTGWKEDDIYASYREQIDGAQSRGETRAGSRGEKMRSALFLSTAGEIMSIKDEETRGICYDDSSMDFLDNQKLVEALTEAEAEIGQPLSLLGMDACLMSMVEVGYQVRNCAEVMVGSQENEPGEGWPYTTVLGALVEHPDMTAQDLGKHIVQAYGDYYMGMSRSGGGTVTQSAIDLRQMEGIGQRLGQLAGLLTRRYDEDFLLERSIGRVLQDVQRFRGDRDYIDLSHFLQLLDQEYHDIGQVPEAVREVQGVLAGQAEQAPVIANFHGMSRPNANGLSVYFPLSGCSVYYDDLPFASLGWQNLIRKRNRVIQPAH